MKKFALIVLLGTMAACGKKLDAGYREVQADSAWAIMLPSGLEPSNELHDFAPIQYWDSKEAFFVLGLSEKKEDIHMRQLNYRLEDYAWFVFSRICNQMDTCIVNQDTLDTNGRLPCWEKVFFATTDSASGLMEIYYKISVCEGQDRFYQILCWTGRDQSLKYHSALDSITASLRELDAPVAALPPVKDSARAGTPAESQ